MFLIYELLRNNGTLAENLIYWPGAYFLSLAILAPLVYSYFKSTIKKAEFLRKQIPPAIAFGFIHHVLSGIIILLGERLLEYPEHYSLSSLLNFYTDEWYLAFHGILWYFILIIIFLLAYYYDSYIQKQRDLQVTEGLLESSSLETLSSQLNPHFLFNAMNNITMLIRKKEDKKAVNMSMALSNLLRRSMSTRHGTRSPLNKELEFLKEYIDLQMLRYDQVKIEINIKPEVGNPEIPQMLLQPLIENAFKHGVNEDSDSIISLTIDVNDGKLNIEIFNTGIFDSSWNLSEKKGIGLHHTVHRLRQFYGSDFTFKIKEESQGVKIIILIPYEK